MAKQIRLIEPSAHRPVNWNEKAVRKALDACGYLLAQAKEDGFRFHAWLDADGAVRVVTREGIEIRSLEEAKKVLCSVLCALPEGFVVDGEVVVPGMPFEEASGHLRRFELIEHHVQFHLFDAFPVSALLMQDAYDVPYETRLTRLEDVLTAWDSACGVLLIDSTPCRTLDEIDAEFERQRTNGREGLVVKVPVLAVRNGKVAGQWKRKPSDTCDGKIVGIVWGTPGLGNAGKIVGFTVALEDGTLCDCTGLTQAQMEEFTALVQDIAPGAHPFKGRYVEVSYMEKTASGSLRHPNFVRFRDLTYAPGWKM